MKTNNFLSLLAGIMLVCSLASPLRAYPPTFSEGLYRWQHSGKWGFIDTSGKPAIPFLWDEVGYEFQNGTVLVQKNGKWGMINKRCELVVPLIWDKIIDYNVPSGLFIVSKEGKFGLIDKSGKVLAEPVWDEMGGFQGGVCPVRKGGKSAAELSGPSDSKTVEDFGKWGFIDTSGRIVEEPGRWRGVGNFIDGRFQVVESGGTVRRPVYRNVKYEGGLMVIDEAYQKERLERDQQVTEKLKGMGYDVGSFFVRAGDRTFKKEGKVGVVDPEGKIIVPAEWDVVYLPAVDGLITVLRGTKHGFYDTQGKLAIPADWEAAGPGGRIWFEGEYAVVKKDGKVGVIDKKGGIVIPLEWDDIGRCEFGDPNFASVCRNGKWGLVDRNNREVVKAEWDFCYNRFVEGLLMVSREDKIGFINESGEFVIPLGGIELGEFLIHEREWIDTQGRKMRAPVLRIEEDSAVFFMNGKETAFPMKRLSEEDRALLRLAL